MKLAAYAFVVGLWFLLLLGYVLLGLCRTGFVCKGLWFDFAMVLAGLRLHLFG